MFLLLFISIARLFCFHHNLDTPVLFCYTHFSIKIRNGVYIMTPALVAVFLGACVVGAIIQTVSGFGFGIFVMTIFPYLFPSYAGSVATSGLLSLSSTTVCTIRMWKHINWKQVFISLIGYTVTSYLVTTFSMGKDELLMKALVVVLILMSMYFLFLNGKISIKAKPVNGILAGGLGGVLSGLFGMGGPPMVVYLLAVSKDTDEYLATIQTYFTLSGIFITTVRIIKGIITWDIVKYWALGSLAVACGIYVGQKIYQRLNADSLRKCVYAFMVFSGITMLFK